ncbi:Retrotransposon gag protein [Corchorus capsularis]|uniref:Retrotransposon gag protein n=1 Tax=Corchorus capsularis TaxID=210143 RepID=A0A1R3KWC1_COCAP|nr:Retrotransposon gag protein [Corchorus capsularis]
MSNQEAKPAITNLPTIGTTPIAAESLRNALVSMVEAWKEQQAENRGCTFIEFKKINPPAFEGHFYPLEAESWIKKMDHLFGLLNCTDEQKVSYATFMLEGDAVHWWEFAKRDIKKPVTWYVFKAAFSGHYLPRSFRKLKELEFLELEQGSMTVNEYDTRFIGLSRFAPNMVTKKGFLAGHFLRGLRPSIRSQLSILKPENYPDLVDDALAIESNLEVSQRTKRLKVLGTIY